MMDSYGTLDLIYSDYGDVEHVWNPKRAVVFVQGEAGFLPWLVGRGIIGDAPIQVEIMSRFMDVENFNTVPETIRPGWLGYQPQSETAVINLTTWFPTSPMPDSNHGMWMRTYPAMRDLVLWLRESGCEELLFLSALNSQRIVPEDEDGLHIFEIGDEEVVPAPFMMPTWFIPYLFDRMGGKAKIMAVEQDEGLFIDDHALSRLGVAVAQSGYRMNTEAMRRSLMKVMQNKEEIEGIEALFNRHHDGHEGGEWE